MTRHVSSGAGESLFSTSSMVRRFPFASPDIMDTMTGTLESMKISVNIPDDQVAFVDSRVADGSYPSRSAAFVEALRQWRLSELAPSYDQAFVEADPIWDLAVADGLTDDSESW